MAKSFIAPQKDAELRQLRDAYIAATEQRIKQILGSVNKHWMG